jgi:hypothetical protein
VRLLPATGTFLWPPLATGAAALPAFRPEIAPVRSSCQFCGAELLFGSCASRLEVELRLCSACPGGEEVQRALVRGVEAGLLSGSEAGAEPFALYMWSPYEAFSDAYRVWKRGWWAGHFAADHSESARRARFAMDVQSGILAPVGCGAAANSSSSSQTNELADCGADCSCPCHGEADDPGPCLPGCRWADPDSPPGCPF